MDVAAKIAETGDAVSAAKRPTKPWTASNTKAGCDELVRRIAAMSPHRIAMEATGGYEQQAFRALREAGLPAVIVQPRAYASSPGRWGSGPRPIRSTP